jgi:ATP-dependent Clp protease adaptor protein ClpS
VTDVKRESEVEILERPGERVKEPELFRVILHNDDYTTMEFVVAVLEAIFHKSPAEAYRIMMTVHLEGRGVAGVYPHEVAETKVEKVHETARAGGFPLRASLEEV